MGSLNHSLLMHGSNFYTELDIFGDGFAIAIRDPYQNPAVYVRRPHSNNLVEVSPQRLTYESIFLLCEGVHLPEIEHNSTMMCSPRAQHILYLSVALTLLLESSLLRCRYLWTRSMTCMRSNLLHFCMLSEQGTRAMCAVCSEMRQRHMQPAGGSLRLQDHHCPTAACQINVALPGGLPSETWQSADACVQFLDGAGRPAFHH